jgi:hypothetical protein
MRGLWFLTNQATGRPAEKPNGTTAFTEDQALRFLKKLPDPA